MKLSGLDHNKNLYNLFLSLSIMPTQDTSEIKEKILFLLRKRGPSLPVHIAREVGLSILFASAFLSELVSERRIKISNMKVGNSPIYFIPGQESLLENFSQYLKSKERDAFILLKEKKFLEDKKQDPAIRVALRAIKDFAIPFKKNEEIFWRYLTIPEKELKTKEKPRKIEKKIDEKLDIFDKKPKKMTKKKTPQKKNDKFFNRVKEFLSKKSIEIVDIESFDKNELILCIKSQGERKLLVAYNKKRINENDIVKANKRALESHLSYIILSLGEPLKKLNSLIDAIKNLSAIEKLK
ncbi:hypothetical protein ES703_107655 [subsurface metagenome]